DSVNVGLSWIYDRGYTGISYSNRRDQYGLPGHSHEYETCHIHDLSLHCGDHDHEGHSDEEAHDHEHEHGGPWIDLKSERYDFKTELN
ncbi:TonB-dependent receptor, partial [Acinetobacter baumannii]